MHPTFVLDSKCVLIIAHVNLSENLSLSMSYILRLEHVPVNSPLLANNA